MGCAIPNLPAAVLETQVKYTNWGGVLDTEGDKASEWWSIFLDWNKGKFCEGLFDGGLIAVHEMLGTAETLDAVEIIVEGNGSSEVFFKGHIPVVFQLFCQTTDLNAGKRYLIQEFAPEIFVQALPFRFGKVFGIEAVAEGIAVAGLAAALAFRAGGGRHGGSFPYS
jgi:hypothetical protein